MELKTLRSLCIPHLETRDSRAQFEMGQRMHLQHIACSFPIRTTVCDIQARAFSYRKSKHFAVVCE